MRAHVYEIEKDLFGFSRKCFHCGEKTEFRITYEEYVRLFADQEYVQDVFPELTNEQREVMISGTHPHCWKEMFGDSDD